MSGKARVYCGRLDAWQTGPRLISTVACAITH